ncbi:hypothetical protein E3E11_06485 [Oecophyllibacter saccharovorans]|uniref:hypothetical protein n=1 Tax=Oecophyllibacter saccharovorans TaxID=2558360 RepID=UPI0011416454|nr:hypothetical protein [Oecophyllibacter saccharovorans]QDH15551.1 hypothetical protein E3E11_06485 [Oecophyllibacter saccharovorans]
MTADFMTPDTTPTYYAVVASDADLTKPVRVFTWLTTDWGDITRYVQAGQKMVKLNWTATEWENRPLTNATLGPDGKGYVGPTIIPPTPLNFQARQQLSRVMNLYAQMGWPLFADPPSDILPYGKALSAIATGADTTSTALPTPPADLAKLLG